MGAHKINRKFIPFQKIFEERYNTPEKKAQFEREYKKFREECRREVLEEVASDVKRARKKAGLTQSELAEILDTKKTVISRIENGKQNLTIDYISKLSAALGKKFEVNIY